MPRIDLARIEAILEPVRPVAPSLGYGITDSQALAWRCNAALDLLRDVLAELRAARALRTAAFEATITVQAGLRTAETKAAHDELRKALFAYDTATADDAATEGTC